MAKSNLKPELHKYSYDNLMTDALKQKQDALIQMGRDEIWQEVISYIELEIIPLLADLGDKKSGELVAHELRKRRKQIEEQN